MMRMEIAIAYVLRGGVIASAFFIFSGLVWSLFGSSDSQSVQLLLSGAKSIEFANSRPEHWITIGILLLIALPIVRVAMTVVLFLNERDYVYLAITCFVLAVLLGGLIFGKNF